ncbi:MAG: hypothetical protein J7623_01330 [Chitinophaga sp.]|uniref:hypothetical protein n=1 Tax=Chitinophaga sp. TaxID=1869181 RepID=UPI001B1FED76|nr:hypothetical protein [Chitinophaga sp.]MBO9727256.1 hypothetical protein [Chitinophaga sp.]
MRKTITDDELTGKVRQMKYMTTDPAGARYDYEISHYNAQGTLLKWEKYSETNALVKHLLYAYNDHGVLQEETLQESDGRIVYTNSYYPDGNYRETIQYYGEDTYKTCYDEAGNVTAQFENDQPTDIETDPYNEQWNTQSITDTDGHPAELIHYYAYGTLHDITKRKYNAQRQLIYEATYASEAALAADKPGSVKTNSYNQQHHLTTYTHDRIDEQGDTRRTTFRYHYQYDEHQNWIEKTETMNNKITGFQDKVQFIRKREITYHP